MKEPATMSGNFREQGSSIILYQSETGQPAIQVQLKDETVWLTQAQMSELFQTERSVITKHIGLVFKSGELIEESNVQKMHIADSDKPVQLYSLDVILSVGYRVNSHRGVQFRIWATKTLREYVVKGFAIDDARLSGQQGNYFDELLERVRRIRTSEQNFYMKVRAVFATSIDYATDSKAANTFFATVQNKFHYAITGFTAAELITTRVSSKKPNMGLVHKKGPQITREEAEVAKNYLEELEIKRLELLVEQFLSFAELQSVEKRPMYMADWTRKLDDFIRLNDKQVLTTSGSVSREAMQEAVDQEFRKYTQAQKLGTTTGIPIPKKVPKRLARDAEQHMLPPPADDADD